MTQPTTSPVSPEAVVGSAWEALGRADEQALEAFIGPQGEEQGHLRGGFARAAVSIEIFDRAMTKAFGPAPARRFASKQPLPALKMSSEAQSAEFATVLTSQAGSEIKIGMIRQGGQWRLTFDGLSALLRLRGVDFPMPNDEALRRMNEMGEAMQAAARDVLTGQYPNADAALQAGREALVDASRGKNAQ